jgi:uncharacterized repeat protein (TIGR03803 family)
MRSRNFSIGSTAAALVALTVFGAATRAVAQTESVLHSFTDNGMDGYRPVAGLILDAAGNLYGTTPYGGVYGDVSLFYSGGTVFELRPNADGGWAEEVLHSFGDGTDGAFPGSSVIIDAAGDLYGTTRGGGAYGATFGGFGTAFMLRPAASQEQILYNFGEKGGDAIDPYSSLIFDASGNLYGTTFEGGTYGVGTVFELTPKKGGGWVEKVLHTFTEDGTDGRYPEASLVLDVAGNLFGTTAYGGTYDSGTAFKLTPSGGGGWTEEQIYTFNYKNSGGAQPIAGLIFDAEGNLYGTATYGDGTGCGGGGCGTAFELMPKAGGGWTETVLHRFNDNGTDGYNPYGGLILDSSGNLYGTTAGGGTYNYGTVFELKRSTGGGGWTETLVHSFGSGQDGKLPYSSLIFDASGNLYGTTTEGGSSTGCANGCGTVFEIMP